MAKAKKSKSGGKAKKDKSAGKAKKDKPGRKRSEGKPESKGKDDKSGSKEKKDKSGSKEKNDKTGSKEKKDKSGSKEKNDKTGSKEKKDKSGGKKKKDKSGSKEKKNKSGDKAKGKPSGKAKKGSKGSSSGKKSALASSSKEKLSSQQKAKGSGGSSTPDSTTSSTAGQAAVSATSSEGLFKPLKRQPFSPLVLPGDRELTLVRRPNTVYVWDWSNMWFFPMSVVAMGLVVLGMVVMSLHLQEAEELQAEGLNSTGVGNGTTVGVNQTTRSWTEAFHSTRSKTVPKRMRRAHERNPSAVMPSFPEHLSASNTWTETTASTVFFATNEDTASTAVVNAEGEADEESSKADSSDVEATQDWLDAPRKDSRRTSPSYMPLINVTTLKGAATDEWAQNATAVKVDES